MSLGPEQHPADARMGVWVDQNLDIGSGSAPEICPNVFKLGVDGLIYTHKEGRILGGMIDGIVVVEPVDEPCVVEAAETDPGENIFIEIVRTDDNDEVREIWDSRQKVWRDWAPERLPGPFDE